MNSLDLDDRDHLVELLFKLLHHIFVAVGNDGDARHVGVVGDAHGERINIEAAA